MSAASGVAVYAQRLAALPRALSILELHPDGLPMADLADELGVTTRDLREVFLAYYLADLVDLGSFGLPVVELFGGDDSDTTGGASGAGPGNDRREWVRVLASDPERELGVDHLSAVELGALFQAGADLLTLEPANDVLREALDAFVVALAPGDADEPTTGDTLAAQDLHRAAEQRRRVEITYVRQWSPGASHRVVDPYRLVRTRRGWELDAGPADDKAAVRTYLVSGITSHRVLAETFPLPAELDNLLAANRASVEVRVVVPQTARWVVERFAETTSVLDDDESDVALLAQLLPPVEQRLGLLLLCAGPDAFVAEPADLADAGAATARALLTHHEQGAPGS